MRSLRSCDDSKMRSITAGESTRSLEFYPSIHRTQLRSRPNGRDMRCIMERRYSWQCRILQSVIKAQSMRHTQSDRISHQTHHDLVPCRSGRSTPLRMRFADVPGFSGRRSLDLLFLRIPAKCIPDNCACEGLSRFEDNRDRAYTRCHRRRSLRLNQYRSRSDRVHLFVHVFQKVARVERHLKPRGLHRVDDSIDSRSRSSQPPMVFQTENDAAFLGLCQTLLQPVDDPTVGGIVRDSWQPWFDSFIGHQFVEILGSPQRPVFTRIVGIPNR